MSNDRRNRRFSKKSEKISEKTDGKSGIRHRSKGMRVHQGISTPRSPRDSTRKSAGRGREGGAVWIWGLHAAQAALSNPRRTVHDIFVTQKTKDKLSIDPAIAVRDMRPSEIDRLLPTGAVHQGVAVKCAPLEWPDLFAIAETADNNGVILVLDQITDPQNVGAMVRLCSAFGVCALVIQDRHAPPFSGALAKVAVGCLETVPVCQVTNIGNTLKELANAGWFVTGLAGETELSVADAVKGGGKQVIVMGAEGPGLRPRVKDCCDQLARIPMHSRRADSKPLPGQAESLNVATAASIALYEIRQSSDR